VASCCGHFITPRLLENDDYSPIRPLVDWLHYNGFTMVTKPAKEFTDASGRRKVKGNMDDQTAPDLYLAAPRGFCAGVDRAIKIVEMALEKWGAPVYVRHEIVHNKFVVDDLRAKGAVFVEELDECPDDRPVIFSAHGVPKAVPAEAARREMLLSMRPARWSARCISRPSGTTRTACR
jgi:hypothetical protein